MRTHNRSSSNPAMRVLVWLLASSSTYASSSCTADFCQPSSEMVTAASGGFDWQSVKIFEIAPKAALQALNLPIKVSAEMIPSTPGARSKGHPHQGPTDDMSFSNLDAATCPFVLVKNTVFSYFNGCSGYCKKEDKGTKNYGIKIIVPGAQDSSSAASLTQQLDATSNGTLSLNLTHSCYDRFKDGLSASAATVKLPSMFLLGIGAVLALPVRVSYGIALVVAVVAILPQVGRGGHVEHEVEHTMENIEEFQPPRQQEQWPQHQRFLQVKQNADTHSNSATSRDMQYRQAYYCVYCL